jgi:hypothetical protein
MTGRLAKVVLFTAVQPALAGCQVAPVEDVQSPAEEFEQAFGGPSGLMDDRNKWYSFDGEFHYIDASGRPQCPYKYSPPISAAPRNETCDGNVGRWDDAENPSNNYDGGH